MIYIQTKRYKTINLKYGLQYFPVWQAVKKKLNTILHYKAEQYSNIVTHPISVTLLF